LRPRRATRHGSRRLMTSFLRSAADACSRRPHLWIFAVALGLRLLVLSLFAGSPHFGVQGGDSRFYHEWALRILDGQWTDGKAFYGLPGYAFLLAGIYAVAGVEPLAVAVLQCTVDAATASIILIIAIRIVSFARKEELGATPSRPALLAGWCAGLGWILFVPAQTFSVILMPTVWIVAAFWACVAIVLHLRSPGRFWSWAGLGLLIGVAAMMVATILFLVPLLIAAIVCTVSPGEPIRRRAVAVLVAVATLIAGVFAGASPAWMHNFFIARERVFLSAHGGINFWIGNYPQANGYPNIPADLRPGQEPLLRDSVRLAQEATGRRLSRAEVSRYWSEKAWAVIREEPGRWVRLLGTKLKNFWNTFQYDDLTIIALLRSEGVLLPGIGFGTAAAIGLMGLALGVPRNRPARWVAAAVLLHMLALMPVFITERYRMAAVPGLLALGAFGLWRLGSALAVRDWKGTALCVALLGVAVMIVSLPVGVARPRSMELYNLGLSELEVGRLDRAQRYLEAAEKYAPNDPSLLFVMGNLALKRGDRDRAKQLYRRVIERDPLNGEVYSNLGLMAMEEGIWPLAEEFLQKAIALEPQDPGAHYLLARTRLEMRNFDGARSAIDAALRLRPREPNFLQLRERLGALPIQ
jgi:tetratricopeptide (TPR) repeat protein